MARIGPKDRIGPPLVTHSPEQFAEIDTLRARVAELEGRLAEADVREESALILLQRLVNEVEGTRIEEEVLREALGNTNVNILYQRAREARDLLGSRPSVQALTRLAEAAVQARPYARFTLELRDAVDAYQAARSGRGEGE